MGMPLFHMWGLFWPPNYFENGKWEMHETLGYARKVYYQSKNIKISTKNFFQVSLLGVRSSLYVEFFNAFITYVACVLCAYCSLTGWTTMLRFAKFVLLFLVKRLSLQLFDALKASFSITWSFKCCWLFEVLSLVHLNLSQT